MTKSILLNGNAFGEVSEDALNELKTNLSAVQASSTHSTITGAYNMELLYTSNQTVFTINQLLESSSSCHCLK